MSKTLFIVASLLAGGMTSYFVSPFAHENKDAINALVTTFTVFGGFLIAVISFAGDPTTLPAGTWRTAESARVALEGSLSRQRALFYMYIFVIALLVASLVMIEPKNVHRISNDLKIWVTRAYVALATTSFMLTLALPHMIVKVQKERMEKEIDARKGARDVE